MRYILIVLTVLFIGCQSEKSLRRQESVVVGVEGFQDQVRYQAQYRMEILR